MTRVAYLDLIGGVAGDMLMAALIDAGADEAVVFGALRTLPLEHGDPRTEVVTRGGIRGLHLLGTPATGQPPRTLGDVTSIIDAGTLPSGVAARAGEVFRRLVAAEARAHGVEPDAVHLHEAGDDDAVFDVVGVLLAVRSLAIDAVSSSAVPLGGGRNAAGSTWPGPAVLELLAGVPVTGPPPDGEATTPTGAALVTTLATAFGAAPAMTIGRAGYGAGTRDGGTAPNLVRVLVGDASDAADAAWSVERDVLVIEANIDDLSPQLVADAVDALFAAGALDAWVTPIQMKRGRLAVTVSALAREADARRVKEAFFRATTTLGVREHAVGRSVLEREFRTVKVRGSDVRIKRGRLGGEVTTLMPEHGDLVALAHASGATVRQLWAEAVDAANQLDAGGELGTDAAEER